MIVILFCGIPASGKTWAANWLAKQFSNSVKCSIVSFDNFERNKDDWNEVSFKESRSYALENVNLIFKENSSIASPIQSVVIIDDIMYLRSMRKKIYTMCKLYDYDSNFLVVYLDVPLSISLERNSSRNQPNRVNENSLHRIAEAFEPPTDRQFVHDRNHIVIESSTEDKYVPKILFLFLFSYLRFGDPE